MNSTSTVIFMKSLKEHVGFVVGNVNAAAAIKQIVAAEEDGITNLEESSRSRYIDNICSCGNKNICRAFGHSNCTDVPTPSISFRTAGLGFE